MDVSLTMILYDSINHEDLSSVDAESILKAAQVDASGKVTESTLSNTPVVFTKEFFDSISLADNVILKFTLNTKDNDVVRIYSDYSIKFNASFIAKPDININLK